MDPHLARALLSAWQLPAFRDALADLIDLDEIAGLLTALATDASDETTRRLLDLVRTASETDSIRDAVLLLLADGTFRAEIAEAVVAALPDRPALAAAIRSAVLDPAVAEEVARILGSPRTRTTLWKVVDSAVAGRRLGLVTGGATLLSKKDVRRLLHALKRHGVLRGLRHPGTPVIPVAQ
ncbi:hypothetical protein [Hamadaea tsunoensis]|uniref:hypothetical protein n=1 Tax=Hamadaea tsunoensis TaxID=53368 RepID=UPI0004151634|nr:hypothetical protein [Hamadaea tsunoensis]